MLTQSKIYDTLEVVQMSLSPTDLFSDEVFNVLNENHEEIDQFMQEVVEAYNSYYENQVELDDISDWQINDEHVKNFILKWMDELESSLFVAN